LQANNPLLRLAILEETDKTTHKIQIPQIISLKVVASQSKNAMQFKLALLETDCL
jgi:hypothetical protein